MNHKILGGKPIIRDTRISVEFILELVRSGMSLADIVREYPHLKKADLEDAILFAKHTVSREQMLPIKVWHQNS